jgi:hypothetical protein
MDEAWHPPQPIEATLDSLPHYLKGNRGYDGERDGLWTARRGEQVFIYNTKDKPVRRALTICDRLLDVEVEPHAIWISP